MTVYAGEQRIITYTNRKRAKDATLALHRIFTRAEEKDYAVKVEVRRHNLSDIYIVHCEYPSYLDDKVDGATILGEPEFDANPDTWILVETYVGEGLSRFRGNS